MRQPASHALLLLAWAGCDQQHVVLGSLRGLDAEAADAEPVDGSALDAGQPVPARDASLPDAEPPRDAEPDTAGEALELEFMANRITGITQLRGCLDACTEVRLVPRGGKPPYEVQWDDGSRAMTRQLCATAITTGHSVSLRDQDSPALPADAGVGELGLFSYTLLVEGHECSADAGMTGEWDVCFLARRAETSCQAKAPAAREEVFVLPDGLPPIELPSLQLSFAGLLLPETVQLLTSQTGCALPEDSYFTVGTSLFSQVVKTCGPAIDARYLHVWTMNANTSVGSLEICQLCR